LKAGPSSRRLILGTFDRVEEQIAVGRSRPSLPRVATDMVCPTHPDTPVGGFAP
jgi:hypothetical protein